LLKRTKVVAKLNGIYPPESTKMSLSSNNQNMDVIDDFLYFRHVISICKISFMLYKILEYKYDQRVLVVFKNFVKHLKFNYGKSLTPINNYIYTNLT
jgi:hypothetical protein